MAPITASAPKMNGATMELREPSLPAKLLTAGSAACVADLITYPLDTAKVRLQVKIKHEFALLSPSGGLRPCLLRDIAHRCCICQINSI